MFSVPNYRRLLLTVIGSGLLLVSGLGIWSYLSISREVTRTASAVGGIALNVGRALMISNRQQFRQLMVSAANAPVLQSYLESPSPGNLALLLADWQLMVSRFGHFRTLMLVSDDGQTLVSARFPNQDGAPELGEAGERCEPCLAVIDRYLHSKLQVYFSLPDQTDAEAGASGFAWSVVTRAGSYDGTAYYLVSESNQMQTIDSMWQGALLGRLLLLSSSGQPLIGLDATGLFLPPHGDPSAVVKSFEQGVDLTNGEDPALLLRWELTANQRQMLLRQRLLSYLWPSVALAGVLLLLAPVITSWWVARRLRWRQAALGRAALDSMAAMIITDPQWRLIEVNSAFSRITGFSDDYVAGMSFDQLLVEGHGEPLTAIEEALKQHGKWRGELWCRRANGDAYAQLTEFNRLVVDSRQSYNIGNFLDLTAQKLLESQLRELSLKDALTGVWNRRKLNEVVDHEIALQERHHQPFALAIIDLDHFKQVNDRYGHDVGDEVLRHAVKVFAGHLRRADLLARVGGEEFVAFLPQTDGDGARVVVERLREALATSGHQPPVTCSIGLACYHPGDSRKSLHRRADEALYLAKAEGRNRVVFADAG